MIFLRLFSIKSTISFLKSIKFFPLGIFNFSSFLRFLIFISDRLLLALLITSIISPFFNLSYGAYNTSLILICFLFLSTP